MASIKYSHLLVLLWCTQFVVNASFGTLKVCKDGYKIDMPVLQDKEQTSAKIKITTYKKNGALLYKHNATLVPPQNEGWHYTKFPAFLLEDERVNIDYQYEYSDGTKDSGVENIIIKEIDIRCQFNLNNKTNSFGTLKVCNDGYRIEMPVLKQKEQTFAKIIITTHDKNGQFVYKHSATLLPPQNEEWHYTKNHVFLVEGDKVNIDYRYEYSDGSNYDGANDIIVKKIDVPCQFSLNEQK